jgi:hypothetical protein
VRGRDLDGKNTGSAPIGDGLGINWPPRRVALHDQPLTYGIEDDLGGVMKIHLLAAQRLPYLSGPPYSKHITNVLTSIDCTAPTNATDETCGQEIRYLLVDRPDTP